MPKDITYLPSNIANYFLWRADKAAVKDITSMKLIKLVYFAYAWHLAFFDKKLFHERIEAWRYGPVVPSVYHEFKKFKNLPIDDYAVEFCWTKEELIYPFIARTDDKIIGLLEMIWHFYGNKSGAHLSQITHEGHAWKWAYEQGENTILQDAQIKERAKVAIEKYEKQCAER